MRRKQFIKTSSLAKNADAIGVVDIYGFTLRGGHMKPGLKNTVYYYHIVTGHHDWGNDSIDSVETHDVCSGCAKKMYEEYIEDSFNRENSLYFECSHECTWDEHEEEEEE